MTLRERYWGAPPSPAPLRITVGTIAGDIVVEDRDGKLLATRGGVEVQLSADERAVARDTIQAIRRPR